MSECNLTGRCVAGCDGRCYPLRPMSWLIAAFLISEDELARDEIDRRHPISVHDKVEMRINGHVYGSPRRAR